MKRIPLVQAPMVNQSDIPFRSLLGKYWAELEQEVHEIFYLETFSQMLTLPEVLDPKMFAFHCSEAFPGEKLNIQVALSNTEEAQVMSERLIEYLDQPKYNHVLGLDLNCGCPQPFAENGQFGAFLIRQDLGRTAAKILEILAHALASLKRPLRLSAKIRLEPKLEQTVEVITRLRPHISRLTIHGRTLEQNRSGKANLDSIKFLVEYFSELETLTNGNVSTGVEGVHALRLTGAAGLMSGEPLLVNPLLLNEVARCWIDAPKPLDLSLLKASPLHWLTAARSAPSSLPQVCSSLCLLEQLPEEPTEKDFYMTRDHLLHILGYRKRSFDQFSKVGRLEEYMLHQRGEGKTIRAALFSSNTIPELAQAVLSLHAYLASI